MTMPEEDAEPAVRWKVRPRSSAAAEGAPSSADVLRQELDRIVHRIRDVTAQGRDSFIEGSESCDRATVAILRLAALFEDEHRFTEELSVVTLEERRGIITTRNIAAHSGYGAMNTSIFWRTMTEHLPEVISRIQVANQL